MLGFLCNGVATTCVYAHLSHNTIFSLTTLRTHAAIHEAIYNYKTAGIYLFTPCMECCGHAESVYTFQLTEKKVMKGRIKESPWRIR